MHRTLTPAELRPIVDPASLPFDSTEKVPDLEQPIGQARATKALAFGLGISRSGYNIFVMGDPETDKREVVERQIGVEAATRLVPADWCYVHRFGDSDAPHALKLVAGQGRRLKHDMQQFIDDLRATLPTVFQQEEYRSRSQEITQQFEQEQRHELEEMQQEAEALGMAMLQTPNGFAFAPVKDGKALDNDAFQQLGDDEKKRIGETINTLNQKLMERLQQVPVKQQQHVRAQRTLAREFSANAVRVLLGGLRRRYQTYPDLLSYFDEVQADVIEHTPMLLAMDTEASGGGAAPAGNVNPERLFARYSVNLLVDHTDSSGAPVVYESNPSVENLIGRVEHRAEMGSLVTDFTLIRAGALHRANGGYLLVDVERVLTRPFAFETLKRALFDRRLKIESMTQLMSVGGAVSLDPDPIPLEVKVVLLGTPQIYYLLSNHDADFAQLFKIAADFADRVDRTAESIEGYSQLIATVARQSRLRPFSRDAVARIIDHSVRIAGDCDKLSALTEKVANLMREADHFASMHSDKLVQRSHVASAIAFQIEQLDRIRSELHERIHQGTVLIDVAGSAVGQINGLTVMQIGEQAFGQPARITATARLGRGELMDIEREAKLGGNIHSKAVMIVSSFIGHRFGQFHPLAFSASLVFEQSYGGIEGDSASVAEVCALLSALSGITLRQDIAVTGSMNQHGRVQAIGGANEKIEGFFDVCSKRGLTGQQGVLLPADNVRHLMLREDVVQAVSEGKFHVYAMHDIDDALALLTGVAAGAADTDGSYPEDSVNGRVAHQLKTFWERSRQALQAQRAAESLGQGDATP